MGLSPWGWLEKILKEREKRQVSKKEKEKRQGKEPKGQRQAASRSQHSQCQNLTDRYRVRGRHSRTTNRLFLIEVGDNDEPFVMYLSYPVPPARLFFCLRGLIFLLVSVAALPLSLLCGSSISPSVWREAEGAKGPICQEWGMLLCLGGGKRATNNLCKEDGESSFILTHVLLHAPFSFHIVPKSC